MVCADRSWITLQKKKQSMGGETGAPHLLNSQDLGKIIRPDRSKIARCHQLFIENLVGNETRMSQAAGKKSRNTATIARFPRLRENSHDADRQPMSTARFGGIEAGGTKF